MRNVSTSYVVTLSPFSNSNLTERQVPLFKMMQRLLVPVERSTQNPSSCVFQRVNQLFLFQKKVSLPCSVFWCYLALAIRIKSSFFNQFPSFLWLVPFHAMTMISLVCCWLHDHWSAICSLCYNWICLHILIIKWLSVISPSCCPACFHPTASPLLVAAESAGCFHWLLPPLIPVCPLHALLLHPPILWCSDASLATVNTNSGRIACYQLEAKIQQNKLR